jgi:hypothetical protein
MAGFFYLPILGLTSLTAVPFAQVATPATTSVEILEIMLGQETSEVTQQEVISICRRSTASTLPTATTPVPAADNAVAGLLTGSTTTNATGIATVTGTLIANTTLRFPFNALGGLLYPFTQTYGAYILKPSSFVTLQFVTAPAANTWSGHILFRETS